MVTKIISANAKTLQLELAWLNRIIQYRIQGPGAANGVRSIFEIEPPDLSAHQSVYADVIRELQLTPEERIVLAMATAPYVKPDMLDPFIRRNAETDRGITAHGGTLPNPHPGFIPTGETVMFLLAPDDLERRFLLHYIFDTEHSFAFNKVLYLKSVGADEPWMSGQLVLYREFLDLITIGQFRKPGYSNDFPAKLIRTDMDWEDLILPQGVLTEIDEIRKWIAYGHVVMKQWKLAKRLRPGYRALFHGPPGTGKTLTACLLGKSAGLPVYRIDLSLVVSKYIGETEKNLGRIFDMAENKNWILFFDEADALFGKRTGTNDAHDRYANQETSFLLQRVEDFNGLVILASNLKGNMDAAFTRRFENMVYFPIPQPEERYQLWQQGFSEETVLEGQINLQQIARQYEISGGSIMNVIRYASLMAASRESNKILPDDLDTGIRKEYEKEGRIMN